LLDKIEILQDIQLAEKQIDEGNGVNDSDAKKMIREKYSE
jgi:hypothetical protein